MIVYKLTSPSNKSYIGLTSKTLNKRLSQHISNWKSNHRGCKKLYCAFDTYPPELWELETLFESENQEEVKNKEIELISKLDTINNGYNILPGGDLSRFGVAITEKHRNQISAANKGKKKPKRSLEHARKISESNKGRIPWNKGSKSSLETRIKLSESHKGYKHSRESKEKISKNHRRYQSPESIEKGRLKRIGFKHSEITKKKFSLSRLGKRHSEESKRKISQTMKQFWQQKHNSFMAL